MNGVDREGDGYKTVGVEGILCCPKCAAKMVNAIYKEWRQRVLRPLNTRWNARLRNMEDDNE